MRFVIFIIISAVIFIKLGAVVRLSAVYRLYIFYAGAESDTVADVYNAFYITMVFCTDGGISA